MTQDKRTLAAAMPLLLIVSVMAVGPVEATPDLEYIGATYGDAIDGTGNPVCSAAGTFMQGHPILAPAPSDLIDCKSGGDEVPIECTAQAGYTCNVSCTIGSQNTSESSIIVYADKQGGSGYIKTEAIGSCIAGGSVATTDSIADSKETSNYASTTKTGTITCKVTSVNGATGSGRCWEPHPVIAEANDSLYCMLNRDDPAKAEGHLACLLD